MTDAAHRPPRLELEGPQRRPRIVALFLVGAAVLIGATAWMTIRLTGQAVEDRVRVELQNTSRLLGGPGFPLSDPAVARVAGFIGADLVAVDARGIVVATSLPPKARETFERARARGAVPPIPSEPQVTQGRLGEVGFTLGVTPLAEGAVYVLYPEDLIARQSRQAWLPVTLVALVAMLLAALLGVASERFLQQARTEALLRLLVSVAHEIRNPLGAIRSLASSLKKRIGEDVDAQPLDIIAAEADRLALLVDGLRTVGLPVRTLRRELDPDTTVREVVQLLQHQLSHRRIDVDDRLAAPGACIEADPAQVRQVVVNLLLNAADAMPRGGQIRIDSRLEPGDDPHWTLTIEDTGAGVPAEVRAQLFKPFFTTKPKGLGVGLYMSRRLVTAHGGTISLDPEHTTGARFVVRWPAPSQPARDAQEVP